jgi:hypothetical protein
MIPQRVVGFTIALYSRLDMKRALIVDTSSMGGNGLYFEALGKTPLANIEIVNNQASVHHDVWRNGVEAPHMDPGISCPECEK